MGNLTLVPDVDASQLIIDGKIKLKSDGPIKRFTPTGLLFEDGSTLDADVVIFATGSVFLPLLRGSPVTLLSSQIRRCTQRIR